MSDRPVFGGVDEYARLIGWELYSVEVVNAHLMLWYDNGRSLMDIGVLSHRSADGSIGYTYNSQANAGPLQVQRLIGHRIQDVSLDSPIELSLAFDNSDVLTIHYEDWREYEARSWWIYEYETPERTGGPLWSANADNGLRTIGEPVNFDWITIYPPLLGRKH